MVIVCGIYFEWEGYEFGSYSDSGVRGWIVRDVIFFIYIVYVVLRRFVFV